MAKRTALATSQQSATTNNAKARRGSSAAAWRRNSRVVSTITSMLCIRVSCGRAARAALQDSLQWNPRPGGAIAEFVSQLVKRLLQFEQPQQAASGCQGGIQRGTARFGIVARQERFAHLLRPGSRQRR